jgi:hypothetical protein
VLSYRYWKTRFAGDPNVIGQKLIVNGYPITVVGVSQAGFEGTDPGLHHRHPRPDHDEKGAGPVEFLLRSRIAVGAGSTPMGG